MSGTTMRPVDFRPAAQPEWIAHYLNADGEHWTRPLAGWLICDEHERNAELDLIALPDGYVTHRYVYAAVCVDDQVEMVADDDRFWYVSGPGEQWAQPAAKDIADEVAARKERAERLASLRAKPHAD